MAALSDLAGTLRAGRLTGFAPISHLLVAAPTTTSAPPSIPVPAPVSLSPIRSNASVANPTGGQWIKTSPALVSAFMADWGLGQYFNASDPLLGVYDQLVAQYADKSAQATNPGRDNATMMYGFLMAKQLAARKKINGDCGQNTSLSVPTIVGVSKIGSTVVGSGVGVAGAVSAIGNLGWAPAIGLAAGIASLALLPIGIFAALAAHHSAAVAQEQSVDCDTVNFFNSYMQTVVAAVQSSKVDWKQAKAYFDSILATAQSNWSKTSQSNPCNAGCMYTNAAKALHDLFVMLYAQPPVATPVQAAPVGPLSTIPFISPYHPAPVAPSTTPQANASAVAVVQTAQASGPSTVNAQYGQPPGAQQGASALVPVVAVGAGLHFLGAF